jgi:hypothetical protein
MTIVSLFVAINGAILVWWIKREIDAREQREQARARTHAKAVAARQAIDRRSAMFGKPSNPLPRSVTPRPRPPQGPSAVTNLPRTVCTTCTRSVTVNVTGKLRVHKDTRGRQCVGSGHQYVSYVIRENPYD